MATKAQAKTTARGLGWRHQQDREALLRKHHNGDRCEWCNRPMYDDANRHKNWDYKADSTKPNSGKLHADHRDMSRAQAIRLGVHPIPRANRLLHGACNVQRGDGGNDHLAASVGGKQMQTTKLVMAWPW